jgi:hypothetical protein
MEPRKIPLDGTFSNHKGLLLKVGEAISNCLHEVDVFELEFKYYLEHTVIVSFIIKMFWRTISWIGCKL